MSHFKSSNGINWHYVQKGKGEVLLFIHGWGVDNRIWRQQTKFFSKFYRVIGIDLPGHGKSDWKKLTLEKYTKDIKEILDHLKVHSFSVIGSSLGGLVALKLFELYTNQVRRMIFVGAMPKFSKSDDFPYGLDVKRIRKLSSQVDTDYPTIINIFFRSLFTRQERETRRYKWLTKFRKYEQPPEKLALIEYLDLLEDEDLRVVLKNAKIPVFFINGRDDYICPEESQVLMKELAPHAHYTFFEHCGHFPFLSKSYEFNEVLNSLLDRS